MSCCRAPRLNVPAPRVAPTPNNQPIEVARLCRYLQLQGTQLPLRLLNGVGYIQVDGQSVELASVLSTLTGCSPDAQSVIREVGAIYSLALSSGTLQRIQNTHGNANVSIDFVRHFR